MNTTEYELLYHNLTVLTVKMVDKTAPEEVIRLTAVYRAFIDDLRAEYGIPVDHWQQVPFELAYGNLEIN